MLYIGHFSFDELDYENKARHGYFACVVDAVASSSAVDLFKARILEMRKINLSFSRIIRIYIEDIVEFKLIPQEPVITRFQSATGEFPKSVSYTLPSVDERQAKAYGLADNIDKQENETSGSYRNSEPFIVFG